jgi:hypothetical protein
MMKSQDEADLSKLGGPSYLCTPPSVWRFLRSRASIDINAVTGESQEGQLRVRIIGVIPNWGGDVV